MLTGLKESYLHHGEFINLLTGLKESSLECKCVFYRPELNAKGKPDGVEF